MHLVEDGPAQPRRPAAALAAVAALGEAARQPQFLQCQSRRPRPCPRVSMWKNRNELGPLDADGVRNLPGADDRAVGRDLERGVADPAGVELDEVDRAAGQVLGEG